MPAEPHIHKKKVPPHTGESKANVIKSDNSTHRLIGRQARATSDGRSSRAEPDASRARTSQCLPSRIYTKQKAPRRRPKANIIKSDNSAHRLISWQARAPHPTGDQVEQSQMPAVRGTSQCLLRRIYTKQKGPHAWSLERSSSISIITRIDLSASRRTHQGRQAHQVEQSQMQAVREPRNACRA